MGRCYYPSWIKVKRKKSEEIPGVKMSSPPKKDRHAVIDVERANELFNHFCTHANTMKSILAVFRLLCETLRLKPAQFPFFYPKLKARLDSWKANAIWAKLDKRSSQRTYGKGKIAAGQRVLVIGAGPCGLRTAIEAQLLGAKVIVIEKRDRYSRNNVLHLWPYNIFDLKGIAAKKFYGKFCAGSIDHISIRQLQCVLLKVALLLGVEVFENTSFDELIEPTDTETAWKAKVTPSDHPVSMFEFDVLIGADGKRNTLNGFKRKEFRGKLAIAITVNFINRHSELESMVEEISGVAFIFNQKFFNDLNEAKGIDLENIVYYRDETHYFVMTAKKHSLLNKGVIISNESDTAKLLSQSNINQEALFQFAREAADYATDYKLPKLDFAVNHYGKPDVAMFDFTSMFQAENSCRIVERKGHRLLTCLVGDSLLEPFWPTGTGCARGFFGGFDAMWSLRSLCLDIMNPLEVLAERESIYRLLAQTTPENTCKGYTSYSLDPSTRYTTFNSKSVLPFQVLHLYDTDDQDHLQEMLKEASVPEKNSIKRRSRDESTISHSALLSWFQKCVDSYPEDVVPRVTDLTSSFRDGMILCAVIHRYRPDLISELGVIRGANDPSRNNEIAFDILEHDLGIPPVMTGGELAKSSKPDTLTMISYLSSIYELFYKDLPQIKRPVTIPEEEMEEVMALNAKNRNSHKARGDAIDNKFPGIGQLVAGEARRNKKRRSGEHTEGTNTTDLNNSLPDKENIRTKKRLAKLLEASNKHNSGKKSFNKEIRSIKKENRYKVIEEQFEGGPKRKIDPVSKYRENKRPKELRRAIGKIDKDDWNIKNIEEKLQLNKNESEMISPNPSSKKDKVPKWSKAAFQDKFNIMKDKLENKAAEEGRSKERRKKYNDIDTSLTRLQKKLREGSTLETGQRGRNKVSALASELFAKSSNPKKNEAVDPPANPERTKKNSFTAKTGSETCHFCSKRVYVVERMSAEGKFFHRSCFRCDYCNILLRLGSYVYKRDGVLGGKFFCIPHYTETYLEKYRYRRKEDEIRDVEAKRRNELRRLTTNNRKSKGDPKSPVKDRLISSFDFQDRGATPERAEFEASIDVNRKEEEHRRNKPAIMDEDEWTDRNFGNSTLGSDEDGEDTSDDSISDLDSDTDDDSRKKDEDDSRPLTADEARQLQREWIKKYDPGRDSDSYIDSSDEDDVSINYEDAEYESSEDDDTDSSATGSSSSSSEKLISRLQVSRPVKKMQELKTSDEPESGSSTEEFVSEDSSSSSDEEFEKISEFYNSELDRSESNTECEFTDSEGRPNPFHKELDGSKRPVAKSPSFHNKIMVINPDHVSQVISLNTNYRSVDPKKYQYKTPNISDRLKKQQQVDSVCVNSNISSRRALNLKKNWATGNNGYSTYSSSLNNKADSAEVDNRLKSLMDRLSNQQKLLKPAENAEPSREMKHLLQASMNLHSRADAPQNGVPFSLKAVCSNATTTIRSPFATSINSVPPIYKSMSVSETKVNVINNNNVNDNTPTDSLSSSVTPPQNITPLVSEKLSVQENETAIPPNDSPSEEEQNNNQKPIEEIPSNENEMDFINADSPNMFVESSKANVEEDDKEDIPPDLEPVIEAINLVNILSDENCYNNITSKGEEDVFESCNEEEDVVAVEAVNELLLISQKESSKSSSNKSLSNHNVTSTPTNNTTQSVIESQINHAKEEDDNDNGNFSGEKENINEDPIPVSPPVTLTDDEITRIYRERNPLEKIAKCKSPRRTMSTRIGNICTSPLPPPPPPPLEDYDEITMTSVTNINSIDLPLIDEDDSSPNSSPIKSTQNLIQPKLPATPITDPEKFGIVRNRSNSKSVPATPTRNTTVDVSPNSSNSVFSDGDLTSEKKSSKKTLMKSISGLFSRSRVSSPEILDNRSVQKVGSSSSSGFSSPGYNSKSGTAPRAIIDEDKLSPDSMKHANLKTFSMRVSHPSTPPVPLSRKIILENSICLDSEEDEDESQMIENTRKSSFSKCHQRMVHKDSKVPPEIVEKILRRGGPKTAKLTKIAQVKRVRRAQELHRQLEELDVSRRDLESRGILIERQLRGEGRIVQEQNESILMQEWFQLLAEKNALVRQEQELLVLTKQLELEDRSNNLEHELRECLFLDSRSQESVVREGEIIKELLEITEAREKLQAMLEKDKKRYLKEDQDIEAQMIAKGLRLTPVRKISAAAAN
nr:F-actin-monooxygenase Mical-like [Lepeophtheirus salmonis]